jgi:tRNA 2-thiocytidine biosynthesis protein TtcA
VAVRNMLRAWETQFPGRIESIFSSICNASPSQLADPALFDFAGLESRRGEPPQVPAVTASDAAPATAAAAASLAALHPTEP